MKTISLKRMASGATSSPSRILLLSFMAMILLGALGLMLPASSLKGSLSFTDALFTATSAGCVTGLSVFDVAATLSPYGQGLLLLLIQLGGLGIMTLSTLFILGAKGRVGFAETLIIQDTFTHSGSRRPSEILGDVIRATAVLEAVGALLLFIRFLVAGMPTPKALWMAVFHSVSAFCNAGFSLFSGSLTPFRGDWVVMAVVSALIVAGGLGFLVISEINGFKHGNPFQKARWHRLSLHTRLVLTTTLVLLVIGTGLTLLLEWENTLGGLPFHEKILAAFFQSVTLRTAGFNTLDIGSLANGTLFLSMIFMFIGASPGSCGGGVKTTTIATLFLMGRSRLKGEAHVFAFSRTIPARSVEKATNLMMMAFTLVALGTLVLLSSELGDLAHTQSRGHFIELLFESVSAFGTVGLSMGITGSLSTLGKWVIIMLMFVGRLGPMVIALAVSRETTSSYRWAEEDIMIG